MRRGAMLSSWASVPRGYSRKRVVRRVWLARASFDRLGVVRIGMTIAETERALGTPLALESFGNEELPCRRAWPSSGFAQVHFMAVHDVIQRIDIEDQSIATDRGAKIGDNAQRIAGCE
jgi:hypothetical protein